MLVEETIAIYHKLRPHYHLNQPFHEAIAVSLSRTNNFDKFQDGTNRRSVSV